MENELLTILIKNRVNPGQQRMVFSLVNTLSELDIDDFTNEINRLIEEESVIGNDFGMSISTLCDVTLKEILDNGGFLTSGDCSLQERFSIFNMLNDLNNLMDSEKETILETILNENEYCAFYRLLSDIINITISRFEEILESINYGSLSKLIFVQPIVFDHEWVIRNIQNLDHKKNILSSVSVISPESFSGTNINDWLENSNFEIKSKNALELGTSYFVLLIISEDTRADPLKGYLDYIEGLIPESLQDETYIAIRDLTLNLIPIKTGEEDDD